MREKKPSSQIYHHDDTVTLFAGDCLQALRQLPDGCVDTCVTSPPYWSLRDYEAEGQIGRERSPQEYADRLVAVFREVRRVLRGRGTVWLNIGDVYNHTGHVPFRSGWQRPKQLTLVPFRVALGLQDDGWWVRNVMVWHKPNATPSSVTDRLANRWEPVFLLAKSEEYYFDLDALRIKPKTSDELELRRAGKGKGKASGKKQLRQWLGSPRHRVNIDGVKTVRVRPDAPDPREVARYLREARARAGLSFDQIADRLGVGRWQVIHYFRLDGSGSRLPPYEVWLKLKEILNLDDRYDELMKYVEKDNIFRNHPRGKNPGDVLSVPLRPFSGGHFATMPLSLAHLLLSATLPPGGTALDPFSGVATTGVAAKVLGGRFIGMEINPEYLEASVARLADVASEARTILGKEELFSADEEPEPAKRGRKGCSRDDFPLFSTWDENDAR